MYMHAHTMQEFSKIPLMWSSFRDQAPPLFSGCLQIIAVCLEGLNKINTAWLEPHVNNIMRENGPTILLEWRTDCWSLIPRTV